MGFSSEERPSTRRYRNLVYYYIELRILIASSQSCHMESSLGSGRGLPPGSPGILKIHRCSNPLNKMESYSQSSAPMGSSNLSVRGTQDTEGRLYVTWTRHLETTFRGKRNLLSK